MTADRSGGTELNDVAGSLTARGWAVGRANSSSRVVQVWETRERVVEYVMSTSPVVEEHEQAQPRSDGDAHTRDARPDGEGAKLHEQHRGD